MGDLDEAFDAEFGDDWGQVGEGGYLTRSRSSLIYHGACLQDESENGKDDQDDYHIEGSSAEGDDDVERAGGEDEDFKFAPSDSPMKLCYPPSPASSGQARAVDEDEAWDVNVWNTRGGPPEGGAEAEDGEEEDAGGALSDGWGSDIDLDEMADQVLTRAEVTIGHWAGGATPTAAPTGPRQGIGSTEEERGSGSGSGTGIGAVVDRQTANRRDEDSQQRDAKRPRLGSGSVGGDGAIGKARALEQSDGPLRHPLPAPSGLPREHRSQSDRQKAPEGPPRDDDDGGGGGGGGASGCAHPMYVQDLCVVCGQEKPEDDDREGAYGRGGGGGSSGSGVSSGSRPPSSSHRSGL